jgi:hypothetical protein
MRRLLFALFFLLTVFPTVPAGALRLGTERVVLPVIGRFAGAGGTQWRTDVFLSNPFSPTINYTLRFYPNGEAPEDRTIAMAPFSTMALTDICLNTYGRSGCAGTLEVLGGALDVEARARIYNVGNPAGQFGQSVPGIGSDFLTRQAFLYGLSTMSGNRLNIGVTNPNDVAVDVTITVFSGNNTHLHSRSVTVQPHRYAQFNDIGASFGIGAHEALAIHMTTAGDRIYGWASEVRSDTGDAVFVFGLSPNS